MRETNIFKTRQESRDAYKNYVDRHISNIKKAFDLVGEDICKYVYKTINFTDTDNISLEDSIDIIKNDLIIHDKSKYDPIEFDAYAAKFYPCEEDLKVPEDIRDKAFDIAWTHHKKVNLHHPDDWMLIRDNTKYIIPMPFNALIEMLMDWIAMSIEFKQSTYKWWIDDPNGRKEKSKMLTKNQLTIIDLALLQFKDKIDFSK